MTASCKFFSPEEGDSIQNVSLSCHIVSDQIAPDHGASPSNSSPTVDINRETLSKGLVNAVQDLNHFFLRRNVEIFNGMPSHLNGHSKAFRDSTEDFLVRDESFVRKVCLMLFHQVNNSSDATIDESAAFFPSFLWVF